MERLISLGIKNRVAQRVLAPEALFRAYLWARTGTLGHRQQPPPQVLNRPLLAAEQWHRALESVKTLRLPPHEDGPKNWDALGALDAILREAPASAAVLDAGAAAYSPLLSWLYLYGYRDLHGINLIFERPFTLGPIRYVPGDITRSPYADERFDAVACLSVIEHGVDEDAFLKEMSRILKPGGLLVVSCDYFAALTDTRGLNAYGTPVRVFDRAQICDLIGKAAGYGLSNTSSLDLECTERVISWKRLNLAFTFLLLAFRKRGRH